jgi:hypothetical protein
MAGPGKYIHSFNPVSGRETVSLVVFNWQSFHRFTQKRTPTPWRAC